MAISIKGVNTGVIRKSNNFIALALKKGGKDNVTIVAMVFFEA